MIKKIKPNWQWRVLLTVICAATLWFAQDKSMADDETQWKQLDMTEDGWLDGTELDGG